MYLILSLFFLHTTGMAQEDFSFVSLVSNNTNKAHPFYNVFIKKDKKYINWLYFHCNGLKNKNTLKTPINKPLIFSIKHANSLVKDTVPNCIHPKLYENEREQEWQSEIPLYGNFPDYIDFHLANDPKTRASIDMSIHRESSNIKITVLTKKGDVVSTIIDKSLKRGSHTIHWNTNDIKSGSYLLFTEIDTHLIIQSIKVEKNWWANLFSRDKEIARTKKTISYSFESSRIQMPEREGHYVLKNRFGTSLGVHLLSEALVKIKLYTINGDYITIIHHGTLDIGESEFLLNEHIENTGWHLIQLSINNTIKHVKVKK